MKRFIIIRERQVFCGAEYVGNGLVELKWRLPGQPEALSPATYATEAEAKDLVVEHSGLANASIGTVEFNLGA